MAERRESDRVGILLDAVRPHWVPSGTAPCRNWVALPGCRRGARFLVNAEDMKPGRSGFPTFESRADCLRWIMLHRLELASNVPGAAIVPVDLAEWMLGIA